MFLEFLSKILYVPLFHNNFNVWIGLFVSLESLHQINWRLRKKKQYGYLLSLHGA